MERRQADDNGTDRIVRQIWRAAAEQALAVSSGLDTHAGGQTRGNAANTMGTDDGGDTDSNSKGTDGNTNTAAEPDDVEEIYQDDGGLVYFDGGTYSLGPSVIGSGSDFVCWVGRWFFVGLYVVLGWVGVVYMCSIVHHCSSLFITFTNNDAIL